MKILLSVPGHLKTVPMNFFVYNTLMKMGHEVILFNFGATSIYSKITKKINSAFFISQINKKLLIAAQIYKPDIFLTIFGFDHDINTILKLKSLGIATMCWWLNDPFQLKRSLNNAAAYDFYFTNAKGCIPDYKNAGIKNAFYLPVGCYPAIHTDLGMQDKEYDICFAGDWGPTRQAIIENLADDFDISLFGPWAKKLPSKSNLHKNIVKDGFFTPNEMAVIFNKSKIVLNIHSWYGKWNYGVNPRVFETPACGAIQISDWKEEIPQLYTPDKEIILYKNIDELRGRLRYILDNFNSHINIAKAAYSKSHAIHTYKNRLEEMFSICGI
ncbi:MAG: glycosyltransferase [Nitrospirae bacterium]|nr:glycosyltransferase [Nitrospirota bacterium]